MFVGHYGVSFAAKAGDPALPLSALMISTQLLDIAWSSLVLTGIEKVRLERRFTETNDLDLYYMPYSHGLLTAAAWSVVAGTVAYLILPGHALTSAALIAAVCFSHWLLDLIVHVRDLPLIGNRLKVGFGLWNYRAIAFAVEIGVLFGGAAVYTTSMNHSSPTIWWFTAALALVLSAVQAFSVFGPPPKSVKALAASALAAYTIIPLIADLAARWFVGR